MSGRIHKYDCSGLDCRDGDSGFARNCDAVTFPDVSVIHHESSMRGNEMAVSGRGQGMCNAAMRYLLPQMLVVPRGACLCSFDASCANDARWHRVERSLPSPPRAFRIGISQLIEADVSRRFPAHASFAQLASKRHKHAPRGATSICSFLRPWRDRTTSIRRGNRAHTRTRVGSMQMVEVHKLPQTNP